eukprot:TRINITY_DN1549_c0_g3_i4.p1 TRINITY_DN1549_c0_g3~~TRINITY_DN1549_c0_g3_i4.p1  ORF type:complete len:119 (-),score=12.94 TRINITY_DN1549_c0_g3_i4:181-537(-)
MSIGVQPSTTSILSFFGFTTFIGVHGLTTFILSNFGFTTFIGVHGVVVVVLNMIVTGCIIGILVVVVWTEVMWVGTATGHGNGANVHYGYNNDCEITCDNEDNRYHTKLAIASNQLNC